MINRENYDINSTILTYIREYVVGGGVLILE